MFVYFFFFKQKTAYEMRISDWSSDVCSSDLNPADFLRHAFARHGRGDGREGNQPDYGTAAVAISPCRAAIRRGIAAKLRWEDRKSVVEGKSVSVRVDLGGRRII